MVGTAGCSCCIEVLAQPDVAVLLAQPDVAVVLAQPDVAALLAQPDVAVLFAQHRISNIKPKCALSQYCQK